MEGIDHLKDNTYMVKHFKELLCPIYENVYRYILCIVKNRLVADDILQSTLLTAYTHFYQLKDERKFKYWIFKIAKREALSYFKNTGKEMSMDLLDYRIAYNSEKDCPENMVISKELNDALIDILNSLDEEERDIIVLHYYSDLPLYEIARIYDINNNTIRTKHRNIKSKIYNELKIRGLI